VLTGGLVSVTGSTNTLNLITRNGDPNPFDIRAQITLGYNGTTEYPQFVQTIHNAGTAVDNKIKFWTSDGTQDGTFPANAILGLTVTNGNIATGGILTNNYYYANGTPVSFGGGSSYGNSNVTTLLAAYGSNTISTTGNITGGNVLTTNAMSATGTVYSSGNTNATAFAVIGSGAVSNVALGFFPPAGTPAQMAIRDYSTANSTMYFDTTIGSANIGGSFQFRGSNAFTAYANINQHGVQTPTTPAFRVYGNGVTSALNTTTNTNGVLNGNNWAVDYNQGSYLNSTTGVFTAPIAGLYQVNLVARVANNTAGASQAVVVKNNGTGGASNQVMWEVAANCTTNHFGVGTTSKLAIGDTLTLKVTQGNVTFDVNDNWSVAFLG